MPKVKSPTTRQMITVEVRANERVSPNFACVTLGGPELEHLENSGYDQCVRLFFPRDHQDELWMPTISNNAWLAQALMMPKTRRPWVRNYTIRRFRPESCEIDIEFALHGDVGPASTWAARAEPGDPAGIFDEGISYLPPEFAEWQLLVGDESAVPAILSILEQSPPTLAAEVFLEVPHSSDIRNDVTCPDGVRLHWSSRDGADSVPGTLALEAVKRADLPSGKFYTWTAGESALPTGLRRHLVNDRKVPKSDIAFAGYWRHGRSSPG